jgi:hypothetical protein
MKHSLELDAGFGEGNTELGHVAVVEVLTLYQDSAAAACARQNLNRVFMRLSGVMIVQEYARSFSALDYPDGETDVSNHAHNANLIVVAGAGEKPVPECVVQWLDQVLPSSDGRPMALVAVSVAANCGAPCVPDRLRVAVESVARRRGITCFSTMVFRSERNHSRR